MLITEEKQIFNSLGSNIIKSELDDKWSYSILKLTVIGNSVEFNLNYYYSNGSKKNTKYKNSFLLSKEVMKLHSLTNAHPNYKNWNRAQFTIFPDGKMEIEYIWDQELQDEVDKYNDESQV